MDPEKIGSGPSSRALSNPDGIESTRESVTPQDTPQSGSETFEAALEAPGDGQSRQMSPLLTSKNDEPTSSRASAESLDALDWENDKTIPDPPKSTFYLFILALSVAGLQLSWATETSAGAPYLQSLGMSKSLLALVWIAGPLGGVLVQPYVGIRSDNCRISWGKRIPFMIGGAVATAASFLALAWAREIVHGVLGIFGADPDSRGVEVCTIIWASVSVYILDFAINAVQAASRAFIVDNAPYHQQEDANAWAGRLAGVGNIISYVFGFLDLTKHFSWLGRSQMQILCAFSAFGLCLTVAISGAYVRERDPREEGPPRKNPGLIAFFVQTVEAAVRMPKQIQKVCIAQFFNWLGWFGFLFYMTIYIGQIKLNPYFAEHPDLNPDKIDEVWVEATRYATFALLIFAITSFMSNLLLPIFVTQTYSLTPEESQALFYVQGDDYATSMWRRLGLVSFSAKIKKTLSLLQIPGLTIRRTWLFSHLMFALLMFSTFLVKDYAGATVITAFVGVPWAVTLWAPFAIISAEVSKRDAEARNHIMRSQSGDAPVTVGTQQDQAGVILGLHNVAVSAPQIVATVISSIIFKLIQKPRGQPYDTSVAWVLRFGGLAALAAAYCTYRIDEESNASIQGPRQYERVMMDEERRRFES